METNTMAAILGNVSTFVTEMLSWCGDIVQFIVSEPIMLFGICLLLVGAAAGVVARLMGIR